MIHTRIAARFVRTAHVRLWSRPLTRVCWPKAAVSVRRFSENHDEHKGEHYSSSWLQDFMKNARVWWRKQAALVRASFLGLGGIFLIFVSWLGNRAGEIGATVISELFSYWVDQKKIQNKKDVEEGAAYRKKLIDKLSGAKYRELATVPRYYFTRDFEDSALRKFLDKEAPMGSGRFLCVVYGPKSAGKTTMITKALRNYARNRAGSEATLTGTNKFLVIQDNVSFRNPNGHGTPAVNILQQLLFGVSTLSEETRLNAVDIAKQAMEEWEEKNVAGEVLFYLQIKIHAEEYLDEYYRFIKLMRELCTVMPARVIVEFSKALPVKSSEVSREHRIYVGELSLVDAQKVWRETGRGKLLESDWILAGKSMGRLVEGEKIDLDTEYMYKLKKVPLDDLQQVLDAYAVGELTEMVVRQKLGVLATKFLQENELDVWDDLVWLSERARAHISASIANRAK